MLLNLCAKTGQSQAAYLPKIGGLNSQSITVRADEVINSIRISAIFEESKPLVSHGQRAVMVSKNNFGDAISSQLREHIFITKL